MKSSLGVDFERNGAAAADGRGGGDGSVLYEGCKEDQS